MEPLNVQHTESKQLDQKVQQDNKLNTKDTKVNTEAHEILGGKDKPSRLQRLLEPWRRPSADSAQASQPTQTRYAKMVASVKRGVTHATARFRNREHGEWKYNPDPKPDPATTPAPAAASAPPAAPARTLKRNDSGDHDLMPPHNADPDLKSPSHKEQLKQLETEKKGIQVKLDALDKQDGTMQSLLRKKKHGNLSDVNSGDLVKLERQHAAYTSQIKKLEGQEAELTKAAAPAKAAAATPPSPPPKDTSKTETEDPTEWLNKELDAMLDDLNPPNPPKE